MSWFRNSFERRTQRGSWFDAFYSAADRQTVETISFHYKQRPRQNHLTILQWLQNVNRVTRNMHLKKKQEGEFCCSSDYSCKRCLVMPSLSSRRQSFACSIMRVGLLINEIQLNFIFTTLDIFKNNAASNTAATFTNTYNDKVPELISWCWRWCDVVGNVV